jgi:hypothetical protein
MEWESIADTVVSALGGKTLANKSYFKRPPRIDC